MNWIEKQVRKAGMKRVAWAVVIVVVLVLFAMTQARYLSSFFKGPQTITKEDLDHLHSANDLKNYWVTLTADELTNTQFEEITVHKNHGIETSRSVTATYFVARVGDRMLAIKMRHFVPGMTVTGALQQQSGNVDDAFFASPEAQEHKGELYPGMVLDTEDFRTDGYIGFTIGFTALIVAIWLGWTGFAWIRDPKEHKQLRQVEGWGDVDQIAERLEMEATGPQAVKLGNAVFTPNFIMRRSSFDFKLMRTDDLIWVFRRITKQKTYFITVGKTHALSVNTAKDSILINGKEKLVVQVMERLATKQPWIIFGYSDDLNKLYKKQREKMVNEVAARKQKAVAAKAA